MLGGRLHHHIPEPVRCLGDAIASLYSPKYLEVEFCELRIDGVLRSTSSESSESGAFAPCPYDSVPRNDMLQLCLVRELRTWAQDCYLPSF
jgi:hypothetical protein